MFYKAKVAVCNALRQKHINARWSPHFVCVCVCVGGGGTWEAVRVLRQARSKFFLHRILYPQFLIDYFMEFLTTSYQLRRSWVR
jgi:hypothetical protein